MSSFRINNNNNSNNNNNNFYSFSTYSGTSVSSTKSECLIPEVSFTKLCAWLLYVKARLFYNICTFIKWSSFFYTTDIIWRTWSPVSGADGPDEGRLSSEGKVSLCTLVRKLTGSFNFLKTLNYYIIYEGIESIYCYLSFSFVVTHKWRHAHNAIWQWFSPTTRGAAKGNLHKTNFWLRHWSIQSMTSFKNDSRYFNLPVHSPRCPTCPFLRLFDTWSHLPVRSKFS